jgi:hypothetical protein
MTKKKYPHLLKFKEADEKSFRGDKNFNAYVFDEAGMTQRTDVVKRWEVNKAIINGG